MTAVPVQPKMKTKDENETSGSRVRRTLFEQTGTPEERLAALTSKNEEFLRQKSLKWGFDFVNDKPLE